MIYWGVLERLIWKKEWVEEKEGERTIMELDYLRYEVASG